jgi:transcriptional repressor NF-X1
VLVHPRFGLTLDELRVEFATALAQSPTLKFDIAFLPSEEIILHARPSDPAVSTIPAPQIEATLKSLKPALVSTARSKKLAESVTLCALDPSRNILRRESDQGADSGGWSTVAAKAATSGASARALMARKTEGFGAKSSFMVLGRKRLDKEKEKGKGKVEEAEKVVEDWEEEMDREEKEQSGDGGVDGDGRSQGQPAGEEVLATVTTTEP